MKLGRATHYEEQIIPPGADLREPRYRREVFHRAYEFHLRYRAHPGCVYYLLPHLARDLQLGTEGKLWLAFVNGNTQNPVTSSLILREFPELPRGKVDQLRAWFRANYDQLAFDTDRRYHKKSFVEAVEAYIALTCGEQEAFFWSCRVSPAARMTNFSVLWPFVMKQFKTFGRLSTFSYLEYLKILGQPIECGELFLEDIQGSRSHRNGLCKVLGRDDLDWHASNPSFNGSYDAALLGWLKEEGAQLLMEAQRRAAGKNWFGDVGYFTLESALCTYKSWHRPNRRYPNCYNDMLVDRIRAAEKAWGYELPTFWEARRAALPAHLRLEDCPNDPGLVPEKQNHYLNTGHTVMLGHVWPELRSAFDVAHG